jgi:hypothetical protein
MNHRWLVIPASCVTALLFSAGCQMDHRGSGMAREEGTVEPGPTTMVAEAPAVPPAEGMPPDQAMYNWSRIEALPPAVQRAFLRQHRNAGVTNVDIQQLETGPNAYRISYINESGTPGVDVYHEDGRLIEQGARHPLDWTFWVSTR